MRTYIREIIQSKTAEKNHYEAVINNPNSTRGRIRIAEKQIKILSAEIAEQVAEYTASAAKIQDAALRDRVMALVFVAPEMPMVGAE